MKSNIVSQHPYSFCLRNINAFYCFIVLVIQQMIVASSSIWIVRLSNNVVSGNNFSTNLILYLTSLVLPYLPAALMSVLLVRWEQDTLRKYIHLFISSNTQQTNLWSDKRRRDEFISTVNHEGSQTISQAIGYYFGLTSSSLNTFLNILTISFLVDYLFVFSYSISLIFGLLLIKLQSGMHQRVASRAQMSRIDLGKSILSFWDNVVLGNAYNLKFWKKNTDLRIDQAIRNNVSASVFQELISIGISLITFLPTLLVAAYGMYLHRNNPVSLSAFVVIMPRLFLILTYTYDFMYLITQFGATKIKVENILKVVELQESEESAYLPRIDWKSIHLEGSNSLNGHLVNIELIKELVNRNGRITVRGKNGSGKSSLLLELKRIFKDNAFYLPSQNHLNFFFGEVDRSTGETLKEQLEEISKNVDAKLILLDEWDANLDTVNQRELSQLIEKIAQKKCVIEVRHR